MYKKALLLLIIFSSMQYSPASFGMDLPGNNNNNNNNNDDDDTNINNNNNNQQQNTSGSFLQSAGNGFLAIGQGLTNGAVGTVIVIGQSAAQSFGGKFGEKCAKSAIDRLFGKSEEEELAIFGNQVTTHGNTVNSTLALGKALTNLELTYLDIKSNDKIEDEQKEGIDSALKTLKEERNKYLKNISRHRELNEAHLNDLEKMNKNRKNN